MSLIIEDQLFSSNDSHSIDQQEIVDGTSHRPSSSNNTSIAQSLLKTFNYLSQSSFEYSIKSTSKDIVNIFISIPFSTINKHFSFVNIQIDTKLNILKSHSHVLSYELKMATLNSKHQRILLNKLIIKSQTQNHMKIMINLINGQLQFTQPYFHFYALTDQSQSQSQSKTNYVLHNIIIGILRKNLIQCEVLLKKFICLFQKDTFFQNHVSTPSNLSSMNHILRYIHRSTIEPVFDMSFGSGKYEKVQILENTQITQIKMILSELASNMREFQTVSLYFASKISLTNLQNVYTSDYFSLSDREQQHLKQRMQYPSSTTKFSPNDQKFVLNVIELYQPNKVKLQKFTRGGFSEIYKSSVNFWHMITPSNDKMEKFSKFTKERSQKTYQNKIQNEAKSAIKKLVNKALVFKKSTNEKNRIPHEQSIVSKFKGISSIFLPQYYKLADDQQFFQQYLIMENLSCPTLNEYMDLHELSMSFLTKIHLALMIAQGLRVLKDCKVVHLDVKPSNCMVTRKMIIKMIDFGESFCKQICQSTHFKPGFTMPYGCPEIIKYSQTMDYDFTQKSDIYSWSVVFFQLLFERVPYFIPSKSIHQKYRNGGYMKSFYYVPQEEQNYGLKEIVSLMRLGIMKGLNNQQYQRPFCNWIVIILKECLSCLVGLQAGWGSNQ